MHLNITYSQNLGDQFQGKMQLDFMMDIIVYQLEKLRGFMQIEGQELMNDLPKLLQ